MNTPPMNTEMNAFSQGVESLKRPAPPSPMMVTPSSSVVTPVDGPIYGNQVARDAILNAASMMHQHGIGPRHLNDMLQAHGFPHHTF